MTLSLIIVCLSYLIFWAHVRVARNDPTFFPLIIGCSDKIASSAETKGLYKMLSVFISGGSRSISCDINDQPLLPLLKELE